MASNTGRGTESQQKLGRIREGKVDVAYRSTYKGLEDLCAEIESMKKTRASMLVARGTLSFNPMDWMNIGDKSSGRLRAAGRCYHCRCCCCRSRSRSRSHCGLSPRLRAGPALGWPGRREGFITRWRGRDTMPRRGVTRMR